MILYSIAGYAGNQQSQLSHLTEQIKNIKNLLQQKHSKRDNLQQDLDKIETQYGEASQKRQQTEQQILQQKQQITAQCGSLYSTSRRAIRPYACGGHSASLLYAALGERPALRQ